MKKIFVCLGIFFGLVLSGMAQDRGAGRGRDSLRVGAGVRGIDRDEDISRVLAALPAHGKCVHVPGVLVELRGVYVLDGLLWFGVRIKNSSALDFHALPMRFYISDRRTWRRRARQEIPLGVAVRREMLIIRSDSAEQLCYALVPRLPGKGQRVTLEYGERNGPRRVSICIGGKQLLNATKLENAEHGGIYRRVGQAAGAVAE